MRVTEDGGTCCVATSDDVVPPQIACERPANGMNQTNRFGDRSAAGSSAVQDSYYRVVPFAGTMAR